MSRNALLVFSAICWVGVAAVALAHVVAGDYLDIHAKIQDAAARGHESGDAPRANTGGS